MLAANVQQRVAAESKCIANVLLAGKQQWVGKFGVLHMNYGFSVYLDLVPHNFSQRMKNIV